MEYTLRSLTTWRPVVSAGATRLEQLATFDGVVVPLLPWKTGPGLRDGFGAMVHALAAVAEGRTRT